MNSLIKKIKSNLFLAAVVLASAFSGGALAKNQCIAADMPKVEANKASWKDFFISSIGAVTSTLTAATCAHYFGEVRHQHKLAIIDIGLNDELKKEAIRQVEALNGAWERHCEKYPYVRQNQELKAQHEERVACVGKKGSQEIFTRRPILSATALKSLKNQQYIYLFGGGLALYLAYRFAKYYYDKNQASSGLFDTCDSSESSTKKSLKATLLLVAFALIGYGIQQEGLA